MRKMKDSGIEWIGEIPAGWEIKYFVQLFSQVKNKNIGLREKNLLSLSYGKIKQKSIETVGGLLPDSFEGYNIIDRNDIVLRLTDLQNDQHSLRVGLSHERGIITSAYCSIRVRGAESPNYLYYYLHTFDIAKGFYGMGSGVRQGLNWDGLKYIKILLPPQHEQDRISVFLNQKTLEIDSMLSKTISSIEEYKKLKQAVITQAVATQQCSHIKLKYLMNVIVDCPHETPTYSFTGNYYVIRTADQALASLRRDEDMYRLDASEFKKRTRRLTLDKDDIVYGREGERWGLACIVPKSNKYCLGQRIMQFRCNTKFLYPKYAMYALNSEPVYLQGVADTIGSTSPHVNISTICNYLLPVPALTEQKEIANYLDAKCAEIDGLIAKKEQLVKELESYKKSLIYEVVTGKREV